MGANSAEHLSLFQIKEGVFTVQFKHIATTHEAFGAGIEPFVLDELGQAVVLCGANGAGKSRILRAAMHRMQTLLHSYRNLDREISQAKRNLSSAHEKREPRDKVLRLELEMRDLDALRRDPSEFFGCLPQETESLFNLTKMEGVLGQVGARGSKQRDAALGYDSFVSGGHWKRSDKLTSSLMDLFEAIAVCYERNRASLPCDKMGSLYSALFDPARDLIGTLMDMELGFAPRGSTCVPTLDGRELASSELSRGQQSLLYYAGCILHALARERLGFESKLYFSGSVILIDEPETNLHPQATKELVSALLNLVGPKGQVWMATHSVALISTLDSDCIRMVEKGKVLPRSRISSSRAIELLVGSPDDIQRLWEVAVGVDRAKARRFLAECILDPTVAKHRHGDPQVYNILRSIEEQHAAGLAVVVLDVGAGAGRLACDLRALHEESENFRIEYIPVEPDEARHVQICAAAAGIMRGDGVARSMEDARSIVGFGANVAVLCNALHEIHPRDWESVLNGIVDSLVPEGVILVCEDLMMPVGELPNDVGYIVLEGDELSALFAGVIEWVRLEHPDAQYRDRLQCIAMRPRGSRVTVESVRHVVKMASSRLRKGVLDLRSGVRDLRDGRELARASMMLLNCHFAMEHF